MIASETIVESLAAACYSHVPRLPPESYYKGVDCLKGLWYPVSEANRSIQEFYSAYNLLGDGSAERVVLVSLMTFPVIREIRTALRLFLHLMEFIDMGRLRDKVAIVTAAAQGIGRATVKRFAQEGAIVYACDLQGRQNHSTASRKLAMRLSPITSRRNRCISCAKLRRSCGARTKDH